MSRKYLIEMHSEIAHMFLHLPEFYNYRFTDKRLFSDYKSRYVTNKDTQEKFEKVVWLYLNDRPTFDAYKNLAKVHLDDIWPGRY